MPRALRVRRSWPVCSPRPSDSRALRCRSTTTSSASAGTPSSPPGSSAASAPSSTPNSRSGSSSRPRPSPGSPTSWSGRAETSGGESWPSCPGPSGSRSRTPSSACGSSAGSRAPARPTTPRSRCASPVRSTVRPCAWRSPTWSPGTSLRTVFAEDADGAHQTVLPVDAAGLPLSTHSLDEEELTEALAAAAARPFDLARELPFRAELFRLAEDDHVLLLVTHHIVSDAWSRGPLARDLTAAYAAVSPARRRRGSRCPCSTPTTASGSVSSSAPRTTRTARSPASSPTGRRPSPDSPTSWPCPPTGRARRWPRTVATASPSGCPRNSPPRSSARRATRRRVRSWCSGGARGAPVPSGGGEDIPIGTPIAGRTDTALDDLVGVFLNTLVLRTDTAGNPTFGDLVARVRETSLRAYAHQDLPFERLVER